MTTNTHLRKNFIYEQHTGMLRRLTGKPYPWRGAGKNRRYLIGPVGDGDMYLHRAVWLYHNGELPSMLDHIDGDTRNNRIENLRPCTNAQNQYNSKVKTNNACGFKGVAYQRGYRKPWRAKIVVKGVLIILGMFDTPEEASTVYDMALLFFAGEFAKVSHA